MYFRGIAVQTFDDFLVVFNFYTRIICYAFETILITLPNDFHVTSEVIEIQVIEIHI